MEQLQSSQRILLLVSTCYVVRVDMSLQNVLVSVTSFRDNFDDLRSANAVGWAYLVCLFMRHRTVVVIEVYARINHQTVFAGLVYHQKGSS
jgi:hypothetical protein